jgi:signal transduction histidine kinase
MIQPEVQIRNMNDAYTISDSLLHSLALGTAAVGGLEFFFRLVEEVGSILQAEQVFISEIIDTSNLRARTIAHWEKVRIVTNFEYELEPFPCKLVFQTNKIHYYPKNVNQLFPREGAKQSYLGIPLESTKGEVLGHLAVMHHTPTNFSEQIISALRVFAARAAAELERLRLEQAVMFSQEQFRVLFEHLPLAVAFCRPEGNVLRWNPSARILFASTDIPAPKHLVEDSAAYDNAFFQVASEIYPSQQLELRCHRMDGKSFWAQITIFTLRLSTQEQVAVVVIFEDVSERRNAIQILEERARLARDLHDAVSQTLWSASLIADVLPGLWQKDSQKAQQRLDQLKQLNRMALAEMRTLLLDLRPKSQADTELGELIAHLISMMQLHSTIQFSFHSEGQAFPLESASQVSLYRIVQEALNNVVRHSEAKTAMVQLSYQTGELCISIVDDGIGFDAAPHRAGHFGLKTMSERAEALGANFAIHSQKQQGTSIRINYKPGG